VKWHDRMVPAGDEWRNQIDHRIEQAHVILLLPTLSCVSLLLRDRRRNRASPTSRGRGPSYSCGATCLRLDSHTVWRAPSTPKRRRANHAVA
jgi:hypothetical protein